jgi:flagellar L-ring protein precursor FlgH
MRKLIVVLVWLSWAGVALGQNLYQAGLYQPLAGDRRAFKAGDVLTVLVVENSSASTTADTSTARKGGAGVGVSSPSSTKNYGLSANDDYSGQGKIQRTGRLLAQITVTVESVDAGGMLWVSGEQLLEVNSEKQQIRLEGRVRPVDIATDNTVPSTRIADAKISYVGKGVLGEQQGPGILSRIMGWLGLL